MNTEQHVASQADMSIGSPKVYRAKRLRGKVKPYGRPHGQLS